MDLSRWVAYGENDSCEIIKNNIVAVTTASVGITKFYDFVFLRMKKGKDALAEQEPTPQQLRKLEEEIDEEIMDEYFDDDDTLKPYIKAFLQTLHRGLYPSVKSESSQKVKNKNLWINISTKSYLRMG